MASLAKKSGRWYVVYNDSTGKQKWVKGYTDKRQTEQLAHQLEDEKTKVQRGDIDPQNEARKVEKAKPVADHIAAYKAHLQAKGASKNHIAYTILDIEKCFEFAAVTSASALTRRHVDQWVLSLKDEDSARTLNRRVGSVQAFLRDMHRQGFISEYVLERYPKQNVRGTEKRKRRALTKEEAAKLLVHVSEPRKFIYTFALRTGLRYSELESLTPANFNFVSRTLTVFANDSKNKKRHQTIPLHKDLLETVKGMCGAREEQIFTLPRQSEAAKLIRADCVAAGVDSTHVDFHGLRHTFITRLAEQLIHPKILQELARHSNIDTTLRYYVHFRQADERAAVDSLD